MRTAAPPRARIDQPASAAVIAALFVAPALVLVPWYTDGDLDGVWAGLLTAGVLAAAGIPLLTRSLRLETRQLADIVFLGLAAKTTGMLARYWFVFGSSDAADAKEYHEEGARLAEHYRSLDFGADLGRQFVGTGFLRALTGLVYTVTGANPYAGFVVFSAIAFAGVFLFFRAFRIAFPEADPRRYAVLLFFLPSLLFWPSSIGKEAWVLFGLGLTSLGMAKILRGHPGGYVALGTGMLATVVVRPHVALVLFIGVSLAFLLKRDRREATLTTPISRVIGLIVVLVVGSIVLARTKSFFDVDDLTLSSVDQVLTDVSDQSGQGGSEYTPVRVRTPVDVPAAVVTVLFRPFVFEAGNSTSRIAALEGGLLFVIVALSWRRLLRALASIVTNPYLAYSLAFVLAFTFAFSAIGNFGILARQRTQLFPFLLVLLAVPPPAQSFFRR